MVALGKVSRGACGLHHVCEHGFRALPQGGNVMARPTAKKALVGRLKIMRALCGRIFGWGMQVSGIGQIGPDKWLRLRDSHCMLGAKNRLVCRAYGSDCEPASSFETPLRGSSG